MSRPAISVRRVTKDEEGSFTELWRSARVEGGTSPEVAARAAAEGRIASALQRDDVRAYLAVGDGRPLGFAVAATSPFSALTEAPCVTIDQLYVVPEARKHGVARHLLGAVTLYADSRGCEQIGCNIPAQHREANRFFARLGFTPQVVRRITTVAALRRRLGTDEQRQHTLEALLHRRRSLRARATASANRLAG
ncbi:GNAT family N-acetyltransferase [Pedococcus sp. 5OH_020]|uniref:GNAT family N-acetyltransferase n=1 Tax=Pedococcus sp. 5OH_020 TaxID=2989814 RepID=UPI0022EA0874|nr:GNAT family N-acetyltransferase [Pedococcus sp. 5OH_020]